MTLIFCVDVAFFHVDDLFTSIISIKYVATCSYIVLTCCDLFKVSLPPTVLNPQPAMKMDRRPDTGVIRIKRVT